MRKALVICGATASGKTALAVACAKRLNSEVVSADSMLIYKGCDVGSAKPSKEEMQGVVHHMIDVAETNSEYSVSDYEREALPIVQKLLDEGKVPVICGGTGFYIKSLLFKSHFGCAPKDDAIRKKYEEILREKGCDYLHTLLESVDSESAEKLHKNDTMRVIRALEIFETTGVKKSAQQDKEEARFDYDAYTIDYPRSVLYERINKRVDIMLQNGLIEEVKHLTDRGITDKNQCMQGIGYKEIYYGLKNGETVQEMADKIKQNSRNYAKRQITFFKKLEKTINLPPQNIDEMAERIIQNL